MWLATRTPSRWQLCSSGHCLSTSRISNVAFLFPFSVEKVMSGRISSRSFSTRLGRAQTFLRSHQHLPKRHISEPRVPNQGSYERAIDKIRDTCSWLLPREVRQAEKATYINVQNSAGIELAVDTQMLMTSPLHRSSPTTLCLTETSVRKATNADTSSLRSSRASK